MAESEPTDDFDWFENVTFAPAGTSAQESAALEHSHSPGKLRLGFYGPDIFVTEGVTSRKNSLGTCVLLQDPATWGEKDDSLRRFAITAGHCVGDVDAFGKFKKFSNLRIRIPKRPWKNFPEDTSNYKHGAKETNHLYNSVVIGKEQIFVHEEHDQNGARTSNNGPYIERRLRFGWSCQLLFQNFRITRNRNRNYEKNSRLQRI